MRAQIACEQGVWRIQFYAPVGNETVAVMEPFESEQDAAQALEALRQLRYPLYCFARGGTGMEGLDFDEADEE